MGIGQDIAEKQVKLTPVEKELRERYVVEFYKDFKPFLALMRLGFAPEYANKYIKTFETDTYVAKLKDAIDHPNDKNQTHTIKLINRTIEENDRALVISTYRDIMQHGEDKNRIAAAKALSAVHGFEKPDTSDNTDDQLIDTMSSLGKKLKEGHV